MTFKLRYGITCLGLMTALWAGAAMVSAAAVSETPQASPSGAQASASADSNVPKGFQLVAENPNLQLFLDLGATQFIVRDRQTGRIWRTNPDLNDPKHPQPPNQLWHDHELSQFIFTYSDSDRRHEKTSDELHEHAKVSYQPIDGGVEATFNIESLGIVVKLDYVLGPNYLEVQIPDSGIYESGKYLLLSIEPLPFFDSGLDSETGYMIVPDGVGAIARFEAVHPRYSGYFEKPVYGEAEPQPATSILSYLERVSQEVQVNLPAFGMVHGDQGFLGVMTEGAFDSEVDAAPAGYVLDHAYRTDANFIYRRQYQLAFSRWNRPTAYTKERIHEDRAVRYYLFQGKDANYVSMADTLGKYLRSKYEIQGRFKEGETAAPLQVRIFNAITQPGAVANHLIVMTTFKQTQEILQKLLDEGVDNMVVTLVGWKQGGFGWATPDQWPVEPALGGEAGLKKLISWAHSKKIKIYLNSDLLQAWPGEGGHFDTVKDVVRDPSHLPIIQHGMYTINPVVAYNKFELPNMPDFKSVGADGLAFQHFGANDYADYNERYPVDRQKWAEADQDIAKLSIQELGGAEVYGGNSYMLGTADAILDAPLEPSKKTFIDEEIPFWPIVVHGLVPYYGEPVNLWSDPQRDLLRNIEFGALPNYELTYRNSSLLLQTWAPNLYSTQYQTWLDDIVQKYGAINKDMGYLAPQAIVGHDQVATNVFMTQYADGSKTFVNYNNDPVTVDGVKVGALDYTLVRGGKK